MSCWLAPGIRCQPLWTSPLIRLFRKSRAATSIHENVERSRHVSSLAVPLFMSLVFHLQLSASHSVSGHKCALKTGKPKGHPSSNNQLVLSKWCFQHGWGFVGISEKTNTTEIVFHASGLRGRIKLGGCLQVENSAPYPGDCPSFWYTESIHS